MNWPVAKVAEFLDKSVSWVEEIIRYAPVMPAEVRGLLETGRLTWSRAKSICRAIKKAEPGQEKAELKLQLAALNKSAKSDRPKRPVTMRQAKERFASLATEKPKATYTLSSEDLLSLVMVLEGKEFSASHTERVEKKLPGLLAAAT